MPEALKLLYEDASLLVVEKAPGLSTEGGSGPTVLEALEGMGKPCFLLHRLDRETGGLLLLARTKEAAATLSREIAEREIRKEYLAVVEGRPSPAAGSLRDLLYRDRTKNKSYVVSRPRKGVKEALLDYRVLESLDAEAGPLTLVRVTLHTGRSHQIRVQFSSRSMPLYGDSRYGSRNRGVSLALWSHRLRFRHPDTGEELTFCSLPPQEGIWAAFGAVGSAAEPMEG